MYHPNPINPLSLGGLGGSLVWVNLLSILVESDSWGWLSVATAFTGTDTAKQSSVSVVLEIVELTCKFNQGSSQVVAYRTILPWMAQETQYCNLRYILGTVYSVNTDASEISPAEVNVSICPTIRTFFSQIDP